MRLLLLTLLVALGAAVHAQTPTSTLSGIVTDDTGETLPGATVFLPEIQRGAATDRDGNYAITGIPAGTYRVEFSSVGYEAQVVYDFEISENQALRLDMVLIEGTLNDHFCCSYVDPKGPIVSTEVFNSHRLMYWELVDRPDRYTSGHGLALTSVYSR